MLHVQWSSRKIDPGSAESASKGNGSFEPAVFERDTLEGDPGGRPWRHTLERDTLKAMRRQWDSTGLNLSQTGLSILKNGCSSMNAKLLRNLTKREESFTKDHETVYIESVILVASVSTEVSSI